MTSIRDARRMKWALRCAILGIILGILSVLAGVFLPDKIDRKLSEGIKEAITWRPDSPADVDARFRSNTGADDPVDLMQFWFFNISNIDEVRNGSTPRLVEVGPYTYRKFRHKLDVSWDAHGRVLYHDYFYNVPWGNASQSAAAYTDQIVTPNVPLIGVLHNIHAAAPAALQPWLDVLARFLEEQDATGEARGLFSIRTPHELLWGYDDAVLSKLARWAPAFVNETRFQLAKNVTSATEARQRPLTVVDTGLNDINATGNIIADAGVRWVSSWPCPERVTGSDALQFRPALTAGDTLQVWVSELFRSARLLVQQDTDLHGVLRVLRFEPDKAQGAPDPCYCQEVEGLMNISGPVAAGPDGPAGRPGPPVFLSLPHYCDADPSLAAALEGVACDRQRHVTYLDVEPTTGITVRAHKRLMMSTQIGAVGSYAEPRVAPGLVMPIFWVEESSVASKQQAAALAESMYGAQRAVRFLRRWPYILGSVCLALSLSTCALVLVVGARAQRGGTSPAPMGDGEQQDAAEYQPIAGGEGSGTETV